MKGFLGGFFSADPHYDQCAVDLCVLGYSQQCAGRISGGARGDRSGGRLFVFDAGAGHSLGDDRSGLGW